MRLAIGAIIAMAMMAFAPYAYGQTVTTFEAHASPRSQDGKRIGCQIEFNAAFPDFTYRAGQFTMVSGSVTLLNYPDKVPVFTTKLVLRDLSEDGKSIDKTTSAPALVSLVGMDGESNIGSVLSNQPGETPGSTLTAYSTDERFVSIMERIMAKGEILFLFNRAKGGTDIRLPVDLSVEDWSADQVKRSEVTKQAFLACTRGLLDDIKRGLRKK